MAWYIQLSIYFIALTISFYTLWHVDFNKFVRIGYKHMALIVYIVLSLALGFMVGKLLNELGALIVNAT